MDRLDMTIRKIRESLSEKAWGHSKRVLQYVQALEPHAGEGLIIASCGHDFGKGNYYRIDGPILGTELREEIAKVDSRNIGLIMELNGYERREIFPVECLIANHENHDAQGCEALSILRSADLYDAARNKITKADWPAYLIEERQGLLLGMIPAEHLRKLEYSR